MSIVWRVKSRFITDVPWELENGLLIAFASFTGGSSFMCDFSFDTCGWTQDMTDNYNWTRFKGPTSSQSTGPTGDHTNGSKELFYS